MRHRKSRAQEGREVIDDPNQRNLVNNVGYMGGSIGYLGGGTMNMDYSYVDHAVAPHYQLWKPPGAYYTRGEAPPPYEEAIAIAHAESLSSCTVSVATSTGRNFPLGVVQDSEAVPNITANTTNLISININGTGPGANVTDIGSADSSIGARSVATITNEDSPFVTSSSNRVGSINSRSNVLNGGDRHNSETNDETSMTIYNHHPSNLLHQSDVIDVSDGNICENSFMQSVPVPAMFNDDMIGDSKFSTYSDKSTDVIKNRLTGKKYHRTIPRHFSVVDPIINPIKTNFMAAGTAATASISSDPSASFTLVQQERMSGDGRDKQNHSSHIVASDRKLTTQLPLDEVMSTRLITRPVLDNEERSPTTQNKSSLNMNLDNEASSGSHNPILPPKAKKQQQQHQQSHQSQAYNKNVGAGNQHQMRDGSLVHQKIMSLPEKANDGNSGVGNKLRELRKSPIHVNHDRGGVLKLHHTVQRLLEETEIPPIKAPIP
uniref:WH2 domain-containing protein n=1 Tax=Anopheles culicifacies TaxID=139723 RepID=A0A182M383_9DIPT